MRYDAQHGSAEERDLDHEVEQQHRCDAVGEMSIENPSGCDQGAFRAEAVAAWTEERVARADANGTSIKADPWGHTYPAGNTPEEIVRGNRAGPKETGLTVEEILTAYREESPAPWTVAR